MTRDQAKTYLKSSGFSDLQISEIERAFIVDFVFNSSMGAKCVEKRMRRLRRMTINEKKMLVKSVLLSNYEMDTLRDAKKTLVMLFGRLTAKDNVNHVAAMITDLEQLLEELAANDNQIIEFENMED